jgi:hypothetical protein
MRGIAKVIACIGIVIVPVLIVSLLLYIKFGATFLDHTPAWNDEVYYWHQAISFAEAGFDSGYYNLNENPAPASFSKAHTWGPVPNIYYGLIMRLTRIELYMIPLINVATFSLTLALVLWVVRPTWLQLGLIASIVFTFSALLNYMPTSLVELLHQSIALGAAVGFYYLLTSRSNRTVLILLSLLLMLAGIMRPIWALLLFPMFVLASDNRSLKSITLSGIKAALLILPVVATYYAITSPYPYSRNHFIEDNTGIIARISGLLQYTISSLQGMMHSEYPLILAHRLQVLLLIALLLGWGGWLWWQSRKTGKPVTHHWEIGLHLYNLAFIYLMIIMLHNTASGEDFRSMGAHLFCSLILLALMQRKWLVGIMVALSLMLMPLLWDYYDLKIGNFNGQVRQEFYQWSAVLDGVLNYEADAPNSWCNTVSASMIYLSNPPGLPLAINPGIGIVHIFAWEESGQYAVPEHFKARYLMFTDDDAAAYTDVSQLREIVRVPDGALYENLDSACEE